MSYGSDPTPDAVAHGDSFETAATLRLGRLMVGWSRLDLALQLYVDSLPGGSVGADVHAQLAKLLGHCDTLADRQLRADFLKWIVGMRELEPMAQTLRNGRWLPDPRRNVVLVLARPGGPSVQRASLKLDELEAVLFRQRALLGEIHRLVMTERGLAPEGVATFLSTQPIDVVERD
jgi:hypothetical protein